MIIPFVVAALENKRKLMMQMLVLTLARALGDNLVRHLTHDATGQILLAATNSPTTQRQINFERYGALLTRLEIACREVFAYLSGGNASGVDVSINYTLRLRKLMDSLKVQPLPATDERTEYWATIGQSSTQLHFITSQSIDKSHPIKTLTIQSTFSHEISFHILLSMNRKFDSESKLISTFSNFVFDFF